MMQTVVPNIDTNILVSDDSNFATASLIVIAFDIMKA